jgi:hypothetical protein
VAKNTSSGQANGLNYFVDAWHNPISCVVFPAGSASAEANGGMPFLFSCGPDGQSTWGSGPGSLPPGMTGADADNISNFRDLPSGMTWVY